MAPNTENTQPAPLSQAEFQALLHDKMRSAIWFTLATMLEEEVNTFVGAQPYEHTPSRRDQRNGTYPRDLVASVGPLKALPVPRTRKGFRTQVFERYQRRQAHLGAAGGFSANRPLAVGR